VSLDLDAMLALFERSAVADLTAYGAVADLLDEGAERELAYAFRWMSRRAKWPHFRDRYAARGKPSRKVPKRHAWAWYRTQFMRNEDSVIGSVTPVAPLRNHGLHFLLMSGEQQVFGSHIEAVQWLAQRLERLRTTWELDEKGTQ
jgi:hypothetical protein